MFDIPIVAGTVTHISKEQLKTMDLESVRQLLLTIQNIVKSTCDKQCEEKTECENYERERDK